MSDREFLDNLPSILIHLSIKLPQTDTRLALTRLQKLVKLGVIPPSCLQYCDEHYSSCITDTMEIACNMIHLMVTHQMNKFCAVTDIAENESGRIGILKSENIKDFNDLAATLMSIDHDTLPKPDFRVRILGLRKALAQQMAEVLCSYVLDNMRGIEKTSDHLRVLGQIIKSFSKNSFTLLRNNLSYPSILLLRAAVLRYDFCNAISAYEHKYLFYNLVDQVFLGLPLQPAGKSDDPDRNISEGSQEESDQTQPVIAVDNITADAYNILCTSLQMVCEGTGFCRISIQSQILSSMRQIYYVRKAAKAPGSDNVNALGRLAEKFTSIGHGHLSVETVAVAGPSIGADFTKEAFRFLETLFNWPQLPGNVRCDPDLKVDEWLSAINLYDLRQDIIQDIDQMTLSDAFASYSARKDLGNAIRSNIELIACSRVASLVTNALRANEHLAYKASKEIPQAPGSETETPGFEELVDNISSSIARDWSAEYIDIRGPTILIIRETAGKYPSLYSNLLCFVHGRSRTLEGEYEDRFQSLSGYHNSVCNDVLVHIDHLVDLSYDHYHTCLKISDESVYAAMKELSNIIECITQDHRTTKSGSQNHSSENSVLLQKIRSSISTRLLSCLQNLVSYYCTSALNELKVEIINYISTKFHASSTLNESEILSDLDLETAVSTKTHRVADIIIEMVSIINKHNTPNQRRDMSSSLNLILARMIRGCGECMEKLGDSHGAKAQVYRTATSILLEDMSFASQHLASSSREGDLPISHTSLAQASNIIEHLGSLV